MYDAYPVHELCFLVMSIHSAEEAIPAQARVGGDTCKGRPPPVGYSCERPAFPVPRLVPSVWLVNEWVKESVDVNTEAAAGMTGWLSDHVHLYTRSRMFPLALWFKGTQYRGDWHCLLGATSLRPSLFLYAGEISAPYKPGWFILYMFKIWSCYQLNDILFNIKSHFK